MPSCLVFSFGPVQSFVAQARRTGDSWAGSYLLSYLAARVIVAVEKANLPGISVVEPSRTGVPLLDAVRAAARMPDATYPSDAIDVASLPNTIVIQLTDMDDPDDIGRKANDALLTAWGEIETDVRTWLLLLLGDGWRGQWDEQIATTWETYWAWGNTALDAYRNLATRKGLRDFSQVSMTHSERCSMCGTRPALWLDDGTPGQTRRKVVACWKDWGTKIVDAKGIPRSLIQPNGRERLCAVCLTKRCLPWVNNPVYRLLREGSAGGSNAAFPSTSTMATVHYRVELLRAARQRQDIAHLLGAYVTQLEKSGLDGHHHRADIFPVWREALDTSLPGVLDTDHTERWLRLDGDVFLFGDAVVNEYSLDPETASSVRRAYASLRRSAAEYDVKPPPVYWALLTMDGDNMGSFMKRCADANVSTESVSAAVNAFAGGVPAIVSKHNGRTVYAGGDDVLAMLPLRDALDAAEELRLAFSAVFSSWDQHREGTQRAEVGQLPTLSGAIVYAHHQAPLGAVIKAGHDLLKTRAKAMPNKDAIALQKLQRSGGGFSCSAKWGDRGNGLAARMKMLTDCVQKDQLSTQFLYWLQREAWLLGPSSGVSPEHRKALIEFQLEKSRHPAPEREARSAQSLAEEVIGVVGLAELPGQQQLAHEPFLMAAFLAGEGREDR